MWSASQNLSTSAIDLTRSRSHIDLYRATHPGRTKFSSISQTHRSTSQDLNHIRDHLRSSAGHEATDYKMLDAMEEEEEVDYYNTCGYSGSGKKKLVLLAFFALVASLACLIGLVSAYVPEKGAAPGEGRGGRHAGSAGGGATHGFTARGSWLEAGCPALTTCHDSSPLTQSLVLALPGVNRRLLGVTGMAALDKLAECGAAVHRLRPVFPAESVPNAYTVASGVYPVVHGVVSERFSTRSSKDFDHSDGMVAKSHSWWREPPIWQDYEQLLGKSSAVYGWPGSEALRPEHHAAPAPPGRYGQEARNAARDWLMQLQQGSASPGLLMVYIRDLMESLVNNGTSDIQRALSNADSELTSLIQLLYSAGRLPCINLVILSEVGLSHCEKGHSHVTDVGQVIDAVLGDRGRSYWKPSNHNFGTTLGVYMEDELSEDEEVQLTDDFIQALDNSVAVYGRRNRPVHWHFPSPGDRVPDFVFQARPGHRMSAMDSPMPACSGLEPGYDPKEDDTAGVLFAMGPHVTPGLKVAESSVLEVHGLLRTLAGLGEKEGANYTEGSLGNLVNKSGYRNNRVECSETPQEETACEPRTDDSCDDSPTAATCPANATLTEEIRSWGTVAHSRQFYDRHTPFGAVRVAEGSPYCLLLQEDYITAYSEDRSLPLYVAYVTDTPSMDPYLDPLSVLPACFHPDPRTSSCVTSRGHDVIRVPLYLPREGGVLYRALDSLTVPMFGQMYKESHSKWSFLSSFENRMIEKHGEILSINGPVFDLDFDGVADQGSDPDSLPSHYFKVLVYCSEDGTRVADCRQGALTAHAFLIPHLAMTGNQNEYLAVSQYVSTVRDVERAAGMSFTPLVTHPLYFTNTKIALNVQEELAN